MTEARAALADAKKITDRASDRMVPVVARRSSPSLPAAKAVKP